MKNSIKTLTILLVTLLFANVSNGANYTLNNTTWSPSTPVQANLTAADSVIIRGNGTWTLTRGVTVNVRISGGTLVQSAYTLTGGISVKGAATISGIGTISGAVTIAQGTLTVSTSSSKSAGSWVMSGGNLTNNSNITGAVTVSATGTLAGTNSVGAVTVSGGTLTVSATKTASSWTLNGGSLASNSNLTGNVTVSGNATISGTGTLRNLAVSGGTLTLGSNKSTSALTLSGGNINLASYTLISSGNTTVSSNATIQSSGTGLFSNGSSRTTIGNGVTLTIDNAEYITDDLTFNTTANDIVTINGGIFSIDNSGNTVSGASASKHINGTARIYYDGANTQDTITLPVGNGTVYAPVRFLFSGNDVNNNALTDITTDYGTHYITVTYIGSKSSNTGIDNTTLAGGVSGIEYWNVSTSSTNPAAKMILSLRTSTLSNTTNISTDIEVAQYNSSTSKWTVLLASLGTNSNNVVPVITTANIAPNTSFTFGSVNARTPFVTPLPVSLIDFSAKANDKSIEVKWSTASEKDNSAFVVEKSIDGQVWSAIGTVKGAKNSNVVNNYGLVDFKAVAGVQYYRLKQIDLDGTVTYSKAIAVNFSKASTLSVNIFPNPAKDALNITTENNASGEVNIQILNSMGESVYNQVVEAGLVQTIDIASFIPGVYYVTVIAEGESKIIRLLKN